MNIFQINDQKIEILNNSWNELERTMNISTQMISRSFGEYPNIVATRNWFSEAYLDPSLCPSCWENKQQKWRFEPIAKQLILTQDYFKALSMTQLKGCRLQKKGID